MMTTWKLAPALAAGCSVVLKPDSATPLTRAAARRARDRGRLPAGRDQRRPGRRPDDRRVPRQASRRRQDRVHRLDGDGRRDHADWPPSRSSGSRSSSGGKSPNIVFADADLADAIPSSVWSIYYSAGQSCEARSASSSSSRSTTTSSPKFADAAEQPQGRRPARPRDADRLADLDRRTATACTATSRRDAAKAPRSSPAARRRRRQGRVLSADRARRRGQRDDGRPGGDLRAGRHDHPVRGREGRDPAWRTTCATG